MSMFRALFVSLAILAMAGCLNIYNRCPGTDGRIRGVYQSTGEMAGCSLIAAFPQIMSDAPDNRGLIWENVLTVPVGLLLFVDTCCEAVMDTVCWPFDAWRASQRKFAYEDDETEERIEEDDK